MLEVEPTDCGRIRPPEVAETTTKPSPAPLQSHSLGGCIIDMPLVELHRQRGHLVFIYLFSQ